MDPPCDDTPDFELIRRMADKTADPVIARAAWGRFYIRHQAYVLGVCSARFGSLLRLDEATDLVQDGFMRAFERAATFIEVCIKNATIIAKKGAGLIGGRNRAVASTTFGCVR